MFRTVEVNMAKGLPITVVPAYGRDYSTSKEVMLHWMAGRDFDVATPGYGAKINREDAERFPLPGGIIRFRFKQKQELLILKLVRGKWRIDSDTTKDREDES